MKQTKTKVIDPSFAYIIPTGGNDKPVKIAFEGQAIVDEAKNHDQSRRNSNLQEVRCGYNSFQQHLCISSYISEIVK